MGGGDRREEGRGEQERRDNGGREEKGGEGRDAEREGGRCGLPFQGRRTGEDNINSMLLFSRIAKTSVAWHLTLHVPDKQSMV